MCLPVDATTTKVLLSLCSRFFGSFCLGLLVSYNR